MIYIEFPITPVAWQRARRQGNRYYDAQLKEKSAMRWEAKIALKGIYFASKAIKVVVEYNFPMPRSWSARKRDRMRGQPHTQTPDLDNLMKFIGDCFNKILWEDDRCIYEFTGRKVWAEEAKVCCGLQEYTAQSLAPLFPEKDEKKLALH